MLYDYLVRWKVGIVAILVLLSIGLWYSVFSNVTAPDRNTGLQEDNLSGASYNKTAVNSDRGINPLSPYFVGFEHLTQSGVTNENLMYVKDFITNYALYEKELVYAKVSYVDGSLNGPKIKGLDMTYTFTIGVNDMKDAELTLSSNVLTKSKTISIKPLTGEKTLSKTFGLVEPN
jgi:hypothetical protein